MPRVGLTPDSVVAAALEIVDHRGSDEVTLAAIADSVGVRTPSLYRHVDSLDDLRRRMAVHAIDQLREHIETRVAEQPDEDGLTAAMYAYREWASRHPERYALVPVAAPRPETRTAAASDRLVATFAAALGDEGLSSTDTVHLLRMIRSAVHGFASIDSVGGFGMDVDIDASFEVLVAAIRTAVAARTSG